MHVLRLHEYIRGCGIHKAVSTGWPLMDVTECMHGVVFMHSINMYIEMYVSDYVYVHHSYEYILRGSCYPCQIPLNAITV